MAKPGSCGYYNSIFAPTPVHSWLPLRSLICLQMAAVCLTVLKKFTGYKVSPHLRASQRHEARRHVTVSSRTAYLYEFMITTTRAYVTKIQAIQGVSGTFSVRHATPGKKLLGTCLAYSSHPSPNASFRIWSSTSTRTLMPLKTKTHFVTQKLKSKRLPMFDKPHSIIHEPGAQSTTDAPSNVP